ncbi:MAG TPA: hypothetical protein VFV52_18625 [Bacilli bacterium]|nr:hypothetical protein [Bacilli bacterium]
MTSSTCRTVSTEEVQRFAAEMAQQIGLTGLLQMEGWANPNLRQLPLPNNLCSLRNQQVRSTISQKSKA